MDNIELKIDDVDFVIYHHPCSDGFGSRWVIENYMRKHHQDKNVVYFPANHGSSPPNLEGRNVLICDFSYPKKVFSNLLDSIIKTNGKILIIDHHKSARDELVDVPNKYKIFDMNHSGAALTWKYIYGDKIQPPLMIQYIEDRDIWKKELPHTDAFSSWFYPLPFDYDTYNEYADDQKLLEGIHNIGLPYLSLNREYIKEALKRVTPKFMNIRNKYYMVCYINSLILKSDIGNEIFNKYPHCDFSAVYSLNDWDNAVSFSLRSTNEHADVSEIAMSLGGGGHRNASGVKIFNICNTLPGIVYDVNKTYHLLEKIHFGTLILRGNKFNMVYANSSTHMYELGAYLLQTKFVNKNNVAIQTANSIKFKRDQIDSSELDDSNISQLDMAIIWNYDGYLDETELKLVFNKSLSVDNRNIIVDTFKTLNIFNLERRIRYKGHNFDLQQILSSIDQDFRL